MSPSSAAGCLAPSSPVPTRALGTGGSANHGSSPLS
uniref:Uncharacterized protein n=1 Tax=Anguilla anguilla TaxID=7936 RepID=A0A0E9XFZ4_ANGAN